MTLDTPRTQPIDVPTSRRIQQLRSLPGAVDAESVRAHTTHPPPPARAASFDAEVGFGSAQVEGALAHGLWVCSDLIQSALKG